MGSIIGGLINGSLNLLAVAGVTVLVVLYKTKPTKQSFIDKAKENNNKDNKVGFWGRTVVSGLLSLASWTDHIHYDDFVFYSRIKIQPPNKQPTYAYGILNDVWF